MLIDKLCYTSKMRYINAGEKFAFAVITLLFCVVSRSITIAAIVLAATGILTVFIGGIPVSYYWKLLKYPLVFLFLSVIAIIVNISKIPLDAFAIPLGNIYLTGSKNGVLQALQLVCTAMASVSCLYFLSLSTPMTDILQVLKKIHCPEILIELMLLIYRFIFILLQISSTISISQKSRLGNRDFKTSCKSVGNIMSVLLIRAFKKSSALYDAMESRCYNGSISVLNETSPPRVREITYIILFECLLAGVFFLLS